jgi:hypothetical protein
MKKLKREVMNAISNFEIEVCLCNEKAMSKKDFGKYKKKYNEALEKSTRKVLVLFWNAVGGLI